jgi:Protein of unknown function (DUF2905)
LFTLSLEGLRPAAASCHAVTFFASSIRFPYTLPMDPTRDLGRLLVIVGIVLTTAGALLYFSGRLPFRLGRLPGDIVHRGEHATFYFPIATSILLSIGLSLILWLVSHFRR